MRPFAALASLAVLGCFALSPGAARAADKPKVLQVAGPEDPLKVAEPEPVPEPELGPLPSDVRLLIGTTVVGVGFSHARPLGAEGGGTVFEGRMDLDFVGRGRQAAVRTRLELAIGGGSRLTGAIGGALLVGVAGSLSPGNYIFGRVGAEGFYRRRAWGYTSMIEAPKLELGVGLGPVVRKGPAFLKTLAMDVALSGGLAVRAWAADEDPTLDPYQRNLAPSFGGTAQLAVSVASLRADYRRVQSDVSLSVIRVQPCLAMTFFAACIDGELAQGAFAKALGGEIVNRAVLSIGLSIGGGLAKWEPQTPPPPSAPKARPSSFPTRGLAPPPSRPYNHRPNAPRRTPL
jgi:hypothetical protein